MLYLSLILITPSEGARAFVCLYLTQVEIGGSFHYHQPALWVHLTLRLCAGRLSTDYRSRVPSALLKFSDPSDYGWLLY